jgi:hypothetical protein
MIKTVIYTYIEKQKGGVKMGKTVTYSVKIDSDIRDYVSKHCSEKGIKIKKFVEKAFVHEIKLENARDQMFDFDRAFDNFEDRKKMTGVDFMQLMEEPETGYGTKKVKRKK